MRVLLFFNELCCSSPQPREQADDAMIRFVRVLRKIHAQRGDAVLISDMNLQDLEIAPGYYPAEWARSRGNLEEWLWIRRRLDLAPPSEVLPDGAGEGADYSCDGRTAKGLAGAHLTDGALVSIPSGPAWDRPWIQAERRTLQEGPDGELDVSPPEDVDVRHASAPEHAEAHTEWLKQVGIADLKHGLELWKSCGFLYPNLSFLPRTEKHLSELRPDWVVPVARELRRIDDAIGEWDPREGMPAWKSKVTPEAETRKRLCEFEDFDGTNRVFDLHGRFTPGDGRVHFRLVPEQRKATVAHIGLKIGI